MLDNQNCNILHQNLLRSIVFSYNFLNSGLPGVMNVFSNLTLKLGMCSIFDLRDFHFTTQ